MAILKEGMALPGYAMQVLSVLRSTAADNSQAVLHGLLVFSASLQYHSIIAAALNYPLLSVMLLTSKLSLSRLY